MKELIELAKKIEDESLRKKVINFIKNPELSHPDFKKYPKMKIEEASSLFTVTSPQGAMTVERSVLVHTKALTELCIYTAEIMKRNYGMELNKDYLIAAAILHDIPKIFEWKRGERGVEHTGILLDHTMLGVAEFYRRNFPEGVIHIIASHFGESGPTPPRNFEALIFHYLDSMLSIVEFYASGAKSQQTTPLLVLDEETIKKLVEMSKTEETKEKS